MKCPNNLICNGNENRFNGVCYQCDNSIIGFFHKKMTISSSIYPNIYSDTPKNYFSNKLDKETKDNLLIKLYNNRLTTGILIIEEINDNCPICLENKNIFVKHPTCNLHNICDVCFKETFFDKELIYPEEPECYKKFAEFLEKNGIQESSNIDLNFHQEGCYNCYCNNPKDSWPKDIKKIYSICSDYDRCYKIMAEEEEENHLKNTNLRKCPICRESKLHI